MGDVRVPHGSRLAPAALVAVAAAVLVGSLVPVHGSGPAPALLGVGGDKWLHGVGYAALAAPLAATLSGAADGARDGRADVRCALVAVAVAAAVGVGVELLQWPLATRTASVGDAVADALGALVGAGAWLAVRRRRN